MKRQLPDGYTVHYKHQYRVVSFNREIRDAQRRHSVGLWQVERWTTLAEIREPGGFVVAAGAAVCRAEDQFCRRIGRAISLGRALKSLAAERPAEQPREIEAA